MSSASRPRSRTTTDIAPSRAPPRNTDVSSSLLNPRSTVDSRKSARSSREPGWHRFSWPSSDAKESQAPSESHGTGRRQSMVTFAGPTVTPSDSISRAKPHPPRSLARYSGSVTQPSYSSRSSHQRSVPYSTSSHRDDPSRTPSFSKSGAPLTATNLEVFNEAKESNRSEATQYDATAQQPTERSYKRRSLPSPRKYSDESRTESQSAQRESRSNTRRYSTTIVDDETLTTPKRPSMTSRRRSTTLAVDETSATPRRPALTSRYRSTTVADDESSRTPRRPTLASRRSSSYQALTQASLSRHSATMSQRRAVVPYLERRDDSTTMSSTASRTSYSKKSTRAKDLYATAAASHCSQMSQNQANSNAEDKTRSPAKTIASSRRDSMSPTTKQTTDHESEQLKQTSAAAGSESASARPPTLPPQPSSHALKSESIDKLDGETPSPLDTGSPDMHWERRVRIVEAKQRDGRLIRDKEVTLRRFHPLPAVA